MREKGKFMKSVKLTNVLTVAVVVGGIGFSSTSVYAVDPQVTTGKVTFTPGDLTLDKVPNFDFGQQPISTQDKLYGTTTKSEVQITDLRGTSTGWGLTVKSTKLAASGKELKGAQISFKGGKASNSNTEAINVVDESTLIPETATKIVFAEAGSGNGISKIAWDESGVRLFVPGSSTKSAEQYTADLTWTLTDAPTQ
ncbi:WxL domain-containing protein [Enterococcus faecalis]|nr:WxL domain-containing protein [Enterococcus faecalis]